MKRFFLFALLTCLITLSSCLASQTGTRCVNLNTVQTACLNGDTVTISYTSVQNDDDAFLVEEYVKGYGIKRVILYMNNGGGSAFIMMDYIDMLRRLKSHGVFIETRARGVIASAAVPIFLMGDKRVISKHSWVMMHPGAWRNRQREAMFGPIPKCYENLFTKIEEDYARIVGDRTKMTYEEALSILRAPDTDECQVWMSADDANSLGFSTEIEE